MEDRYEIRGKIGAGGLGVVYRGFDVKMRREVAIKRILTNPDDPSIQEEATKQLAAEAGALASLQHPHIVTVYDVGHDEDGPYVVMELINGYTLDDVIEANPMTWDDFRELAMQTQEALIAAQELNMIHSDLKPPNLMLTWLPSGKFQVKIVDFGLAMLAQNQNAEELATIDTVFGSVFFMPPEQFEREVLDARSDLYSMGCVYYQCLTGKYPFMGCDGEEVMNAHLKHTVTPIQDIRADVPLWVCDWVMWQINREREDRPQSSRESLAVFLQNNHQSNPELSKGRPPSKGPKLILPGQNGEDANAPEPIRGVKIKPPGDKESVQDMAIFEDVTEDEDPPIVEESTNQAIEVQPISPSAETSDTHDIASSPLSSSAPQSSSQESQKPDQAPTVIPLAKPPKPPMSAAAKGMIGAVLGIAIIIVVWMILSQSKQNKANERLSDLLKKAAKAEVTELPMTRSDLNLLLGNIAHTGAIENRDAYYTALIKAKAPDGVNFDIAILNFAKEPNLRAEARSNLIRHVIGFRESPGVLPLLLNYATETTERGVAIDCYRAAYGMGNDGHVMQYLDAIATTEDLSLQREVELNLGHIIDNSLARESISSKVLAAYEKSKDQTAKYALIRILGRCSTNEALLQISSALEAEDINTRRAATKALSEWKDIQGIETLLAFLDKTTDPKLREEAFDSVVQIGSQDFVTNDPAKAQAIWRRIKVQARSPSEKREIINAVTPINAPWSKPMVQSYLYDPDAEVKKRAQEAMAYFKRKEEEKGNQ